MGRYFRRDCFRARRRVGTSERLLSRSFLRVADGGSGGAVSLANAGAITLSTAASPSFTDQGTRALAAQSIGGAPGSGGKATGATGGQDGPSDAFRR